MDSKAAQHAFHNLVLTGKGGLVLLLLVLSLVNAHTEYIEKEPRKFFGGVLNFALTGALAGGFVAWNRGGDTEMIFNTVFISTLFFFFFGVCREFSGYYKLTSGETAGSQKMAQEAKVLKYLAIVLVAIMAPLAIWFTYKATKAGANGVSNTAPRGLKWPFPVELLIFTTICGLGEYGVSYQHGEKGGMAVATSFGLYLAAHLFLQYGGFYKHVFAPVSWNKFN